MYVYICDFGYMDTYNLRPGNLTVCGLLWTGHTCKEKKSQKNKDSSNITGRSLLMIIEQLRESSEIFC